MKRPGIRTGILVGIILTAPLLAIFYVADQVVGLPFVPFDLFDWLAQVLPGNVITAAIDLMVDTVRALNLGETSSTAGVLEQLAALGFFLTIGVITVAIFYVLLKRRPSLPSGLASGLVLGIVVGVPFVLISLAINSTATTPAGVNAIWILALFLGWGAAVGWVHQNLSIAVASGEDADRVVATEAMNRRQFLIRVGNASAVITVAGAGLGALLSAAPSERSLSDGAAAATTDPDALPNADASVEPAPGTRAEITPVDEHYTIDIASRPPTITEEGWVLPITGLVANELELTLDDLRNDFDSMDQYITLACISNRVAGDLIGTQRWTGVSLQQILAAAGVQEDAQYLVIESADGFHETVDLELIDADERIMLCYAWDGQPLTQEHGFPLRIYIPDRFGMKQPKWITSITVTDTFEEGYWVRRGWDAVAQMRATAVIDTVATEAMVEVDGQMLIPIGGIAHAGARGISRVEVQVDDGEWQEAELRDPLSETTWVIWRYDWEFDEGEHTFAVRCFEGDGTMQIVEENRPRPSGATGIHSETVRI